MQLTIRDLPHSVKEEWRASDRAESRHSKLPRPSASADPHIVASRTGRAFQARDGQEYTLRRVTPADAEPLAEFVRRLSGETRRLRLMTSRPCSPEFVRAEVARLLVGATGNAITLIVTLAGYEASAVVAVAELACDYEQGTGEVGVVVSDDAQRKGIASVLLRQILRIAQELGLAQLHSDMFAENFAVRRLIQTLGIDYTAKIQAGEMHMIVRVPEHNDRSA